MDNNEAKIKKIMFLSSIGKLGKKFAIKICY
jgi:hypothetical protein